MPGESWESFSDSFGRLLALQPHKIQVGVLKRLKGAPISRHIPARKMVFADQAPYEILQTDLLDFSQLQRIKRYARYFDLYYNSGNFPRSLPLLWHTTSSPFTAFMAFSDWLWSSTRRTHELPLAQLAGYLYEFLIRSGADEPTTIASAIEQDFHRLPGRKEKLPFLPRRSK